jgi:glycosyltransferase involved in cell wall biosynthesis
MTQTTRETLAVWTPSLDEVNGQNLITRRVVERQTNQIGRIYAYPPGGGFAIPRTLLTALGLCLAMFAGRHHGVYLVCSRSTVGFIRDLPPLAMSLFGHRVIVHVHGSDFPSLFRRRCWGPLARLLYKNCEIIVPSAHLIPLLQEIRFRRIEVCENFSWIPDSLTYDKKNRASLKSSFTVLWNSNLMSSKGIRELVDGLRLLHDEGFPIQLVILGVAIDDSEASKEEINAFIHSISSEKWIEVKGSVLPEDVAIHLDACDAVALPSTYVSECQPLSIIQAMLVGRIVLVTPTAALRATVGSYPAIFAERSAQAIAKAFRPYVAGIAGQEERISLEIEVASWRFSRSAFDARIERILEG